MFSFGPLRPLCVHLLSRLKSPNQNVFNHKMDISCKYFSKNSNYFKKVTKSEPLNSEKDKLLFYYENPTFFKALNVFAFVQFLFWCSAAKFTYSPIKDVKADEEAKGKLPWWMRLDFNSEGTRKMVSAACLFVSYSIMAVAYLYTTRSVRLLVLRKDKDTVTFVTYSIFGRKMYLDVPLNKMSTNVSRMSAKGQLPIKVQGRRFFYILDTKKGTFPNPELFDHTAGMKRTLK